MFCFMKCWHRLRNVSLEGVKHLTELINCTLVRVCSLAIQVSITVIKSPEVVSDADLGSRVQRPTRLSNYARSSSLVTPLFSRNRRTESVKQPIRRTVALCQPKQMTPINRANVPMTNSTLCFVYSLFITRGVRNLAALLAIGRGTLDKNRQCRHRNLQGRLDLHSTNKLFICK